MRTGLINDMNPPKARQSKMPRVYVHFFLGVSLVVAIIFITVQLFYVASGNITRNLLFFNLTLFTVIFLLIMGTSYLLVRRAVLQQVEYKLNLEEANAFTESILDSLPDTYHLFDLEGRPLKWNKAAREVTGYSDEEISSMAPADFVSEEDRNWLESATAEVLEKGRGISFGVTVVTKDGSRIPFEYGGSLLTDQDGNAIGFGAVGRDITERKKAEGELKRVNTELEGYAHTVSHDLKGPLSAVSLAVDMLGEALEGLKSGSLEGIEMVDEIVSSLGRNAEKAHRRIRDLLSLAESGQQPGKVSPVDVTELVQEILDECSQALKERSVEVKVSPDLGTVTGDPTQVQQVFSNLVDNAIRYNDSEDPVIRISHLGDDDGGHRYLVRDNGSGIAEDIIDKVFIPFTKGKDGDTGIGLSIVERMVNAYGGEMKAYNDNGACFEFTLRDYPE